MTGKDMIMFILQHDLINEELFPDGVFVGFMNEKEAAEKFNVGVGTIRVWNLMGKLSGFSLGDHLYFYKNITDPRLNSKRKE